MTKSFEMIYILYIYISGPFIFFALVMKLCLRQKNRRLGHRDGFIRVFRCVILQEKRLYAGYSFLFLFYSLSLCIYVYL